ncbi:MAG: C40 family peptidase [Pseudomonadota bacterium]|uniref:C40 family peptidase n=1 Tax=Halomonas sp. IOP_31 TaxID=2876584 RepID=UPI001E339451|nr:C40 family peptidase [Halomonas sp. IOP_31]MCD6009206.1 C40 family peptidase [Halomonas sp. IOP_31]MEA3252216.1 C40 family peptidase [Pseudomonadota bacterium]
MIRSDTRRWLSPLLLILTYLSLAGCAGPQMQMADSDDTPADSLSIERAMILANARQALGLPYRYGGASPSGVDCSGLVQMTYGAAGIAVPRTAEQQRRQLPQRKRARPGDLMFFGTGSKATHVGIYMGDQRMIHAPGSGRTVTVTSLSIDYWRERYLGAAGPAP